MPTGNKRGGTQAKGRVGRGGVALAHGETDKRGKRTFDRQSGTGAAKGQQSKGGHGKHNWGTLEEGGAGNEEEETTEQGGDAAAAGATDGAAAGAVGEDGKEIKAADQAPAKPAEPEDKSVSFDEYQAQLAKKQVENDKLKARDVQVDDKKWGVTGVFKKAETEENLKIGGKDAKKKEKDRKGRKHISLDEFVGKDAPTSPQSSSPAAASQSPSNTGGDRDNRPFERADRGDRGGDRPFRGGRGGGDRGRGGRGRGDGRGRGRGGRGFGESFACLKCLVVPSC